MNRVNDNIERMNARKVALANQKKIEENEEGKILPQL